MLASLIVYVRLFVFSLWPRLLHHLARSLGGASRHSREYKMYRDLAFNNRIKKYLRVKNRREAEEEEARSWYFFITRAWWARLGLVVVLPFFYSYITARGFELRNEILSHSLLPRQIFMIGTEKSISYFGAFWGFFLRRAWKFASCWSIMFFTSAALPPGLVWLAWPGSKVSGRAARAESFFDLSLTLESGGRVIPTEQREIRSLKAIWDAITCDVSWLALECWNARLLFVELLEPVKHDRHDNPLDLNHESRTRLFSLPALTTQDPNRYFPRQHVTRSSPSRRDDSHEIARKRNFSHRARGVDDPIPPQNDSLNQRIIYACCEEGSGFLCNAVRYVTVRGLG